jgi:type II secretory pathway component PulK
MKLSLKKNRRTGMALVSVLLMSALLIALYLRFLDNAGLQARISAHQEAIAQTQWAARAGVDYAIALLFQDRSIGDSYTESWKTLTDATLADPIMFGPCSFTVEVIDESSKLNVNLVEEGILFKTLEYYELGIVASGVLLTEAELEGGALRLTHHILDYIDEDDSPREFGAEFSTYMLHGKNEPRNGPMSDIRELLEIPGITPDLMIASGSRPGLEDLLTVYGKGEININTAMEGIIRAVPGLPAEYDLERRTEYYDRLFAARPFMQLAGYTNFIVAFDWRIKKSYTNRFITHTKWFKIKTHAQYGEAHRWVEALVKRDRPGQCRLVRYVEMP